MEADKREQELKMCITPKTITLDICRSCKRSTKEETLNTQQFYPKKKTFAWVCEGYINLN